MKIRNFVSESRLENWRENTNCWDRREKKVETKDRFMTVGIAATELHKHTYPGCTAVAASESLKGWHASERHSELYRRNIIQTFTAVLRSQLT